MENVPTIINEENIFMDIQKFEHVQRVGNLFASSTLVPETFRNSVGNCVIALDFANRTGTPPLMVMQKMYVIHGKPAIETQLQLALFNKLGKFTTLKYEESGEGMGKACFAYATEVATGEKLEGPVVSMEMAKAEGWLSKRGSKWQTLPDLMLRYRSASFFIKTYCPEAVLGIPTTDEVIEQGPKDITAEANQIDFKNKLKNVVSDKKENPTAEDVDHGQDEKDEPETEPHPWDRPNWINVRKAGFSTFVMKNKETFNEAHEEIQAEARKKWAGLYPDDPFVLDALENNSIENGAPGEDQKEVTQERCGVFGTGLADGFFMKANGIDQALKYAQDIWDHPTKYRDNIGADDSTQAYNKFLKHLLVCVDGVEKPIFDIVKKEKASTVTVNGQYVDCPNGEGRRSVVHCNSTCKSRPGCPAFE